MYKCPEEKIIERKLNMRRNRMKNWKAVIAGFLFFCLLPVFSFSVVWAEEEETEDPIPAPLSGIWATLNV